MLKNKRILPSIFKYSLIFPEFKNGSLTTQQRNRIPEKLRKIKRNLSTYPNLDIRTLAKDIDTVMKLTIFSMTEQIISEYLEVQKEFYKLFPDCPTLYNVFDLMKEFDADVYYTMCWSFVEYSVKKDIIHLSKYEEIFSK